jgi:Mn2+/Fe2+ NRAMP family transporter
MKQVDREALAQAEAAGGLTRLKVYTRLSGPGWLQSAITLGGGSLAGALFLGVIGGYSILWVQLLAMVLGVILLCAISYVTLSTGRSPFEAIRTEINPVLAWGWLLATLTANLVWVLPQYSLAYGAVSQNLMPGLFDGAGDGAKYLVSGVILAVVTGITLCYGSGSLGIRIYEWVLKLVVAGIVLCFMAVVVKLATTAEDFALGEALRGFIPDPSILYRPSQAFHALLGQIPDPAVQSYWSQEIVEAQRMRLVGAAATAVGINMTFLLPYSMLSRHWSREHRGLAIFDLSTGMVIPYVLAVSCVAIAAAYMFHGKPYEGLIETRDGQVTVVESSAGKGDFDKLIKSRNNEEGLEAIALSNAEKQLAARLVPRSTANFAASLSNLSGDPGFANTVFGLGVLAMALSTISLLSLISGFVFCEMLGAAHGGPVHKAGILTGAVGVLWPVFWDGGSKAFLAVVASTFGYILFPIASLTFLLMMNSKRLLGDQLPRGRSRVLWNTLLGTSLLITGLAAGHTATTKQFAGYPVGTIGLCLFLVLVAIGHFRLKNRHARVASDRKEPQP